MDIFIEPTTVSFSVVRLTYEIVRLVPNSHCYIQAYLTESGGNRLKRYELLLAGTDYSQWGEDDTYLTNWICTQCGVSPKPEPEPTPETVVPDIFPIPTVEETMTTTDPTPNPEETTPTP